MSTRPICLIVEDEAFIALDLEDGLVDAGFVVRGPFATCQAALLSVEHQPPDVAVLDVVVRDGDCLELARELTRRGIPFLIHSGHTQAHQNAPEFANAPWLVKPSRHGDVVRFVKSLLASGSGAKSPSVS